MPRPGNSLHDCLGVVAGQLGHLAELNEYRLCVPAPFPQQVHGISRRILIQHHLLPFPAPDPAAEVDITSKVLRVVEALHCVHCNRLGPIQVEGVHGVKTHRPSKPVVRQEGGRQSDAQ